MRVLGLEWISLLLFRGFLYKHRYIWCCGIVIWILLLLYYYCYLYYYRLWKINMQEYWVRRCFINIMCHIRKSKYQKSMVRVRAVGGWCHISRESFVNTSLSTQFCQIPDVSSCSCWALWETFLWFFTTNLGVWRARWLLTCGRQFSPFSGYAPITFFLQQNQNLSWNWQKCCPFCSAGFQHKKECIKNCKCWKLQLTFFSLFLSVF